jgi:decaprenylphospho-beta-D-ribofuranose 2-oxidase
MSPDRVLLRGWGRTAPTASDLARPRSVEDVSALLAKPPPRGVIARGLGRAYGDAAQDAGGLVVDCTALAPTFVLDPSCGTLTASAGLSLDQLMRMLLPQGWFVPVTPGTRYVTVGGAIAADIHGKNHHRDGSFGRAVTSLTLVVPGGDVRVLTPEAEPELFWATVGGMGLTGVITEATFRCLPVETSRMRVDTERARNLAAALELMRTTDDSYRYTVAWIDLLAKGATMGRSVLTRGDHATVDELGDRAARDPLRFAPRQRISAPPWVPSGLLNRATVAAFNEVWFRKAPRERRGEIQELSAFFHPLDGVRRWNLLYGQRGFLQYQFVVPFGAEEALHEIVHLLSGRGVASFLAVLKRFGPGSPAPLSFPMPGWTLALDIPVGGAELGALLRELDRRVIAAGGRVYLAKDSVLDPASMAAMYPGLPAWRESRRTVDPDGVLQSDLARRLQL